MAGPGLRDLTAAMLMATVLLPYVSLLVRGEMPYVRDIATTAAVSLAMGAAAFVVSGRITLRTLVGRAEVGFAAAALVLGLMSIAFGETPFGQLLLLAFVSTMLLTWAVQLLDHVGRGDPGNNLHGDRYSRRAGSRSARTSR
jgi:hypothetical protein